MSDNTLPPIESVSGGSHGVTAGYQQMLGLAGRYEDKARGFVEMAGLGARVMANGDLLESSILSPLSFADAEAQVLDATTGANGLTIRAIGIEADALGVRAVVGAFKISDVLSRQLSELVDYSIGRLLPFALPAMIPAGLIAAAYYATLSPAEQEKFLENLQNQLHEHPELAQHLINGGGGLLDTLLPGGSLIGLLNPGDGPLLNPTTNDAARLLALLLGDDTGFNSEELNNISPTLNQSHAPNSLEDLMKSLNDTNLLDAEDENLEGTIQIQQIGEKPNERYIVIVPGTDDMGPIPAGDSTVRDMETNYQLIGGMDNAYSEGIAKAMADAGLEGKDVMMVGHSQGGMAVTALAADPEFNEKFNVKHVVTAGSPTAQVPDLPGSTHAIHFENRGDAVPLLDGENNPDQPNRTTVKFDEGGHSISDNHAITHYANGAAAADASTNGSIQSEIDRMREDGFLGGDSVGGVRTFQITRG